MELKGLVKGYGENDRGQSAMTINYFDVNAKRVLSNPALGMLLPSLCGFVQLLKTGFNTLMDPTPILISCGLGARLKLTSRVFCQKSFLVPYITNWVGAIYFKRSWLLWEYDPATSETWIKNQCGL